jgi:hypothetical protein
MSDDGMNPEVTQIIDKLLEGFEIGKDPATTSMMAATGVQRILGMMIDTVQAAIDCINKNDCSCPVCAESLDLLSHLKNATTQLKDAFPTSTNNPIEAVYLLGNATTLAASTPLHIMQITRLIEAAHGAFGTLLTSDIKVVRVEHDKPKDTDKKPN